MYNLPINIIYGQMQTQMEGDILRAVQQYGIDVDKDELIRALRYDRDQYDRGFADGHMDAQQEIVRCRDCKWCSHNTPDGFHWCDEHERGSLCDDDFCSCGVNKNDDLSL
jgi:hypothetical protein